jgi:hypothetical protein
MERGCASLSANGEDVSEGRWNCELDRFPFSWDV